MRLLTTMLHVSVLGAALLPVPASGQLNTPDVRTSPPRPRRTRGRSSGATRP